MKFGYAFWGFLADQKIEKSELVSTPDGNATYSWSILWEAQRRGWDTWLLQKDRDAEYINGNLWSAFGCFSMHKRWEAWYKTNKTITTNNIVLSELEDLPDLDVILIEWRFPILGRNCGISKDDEKYQPDLDRQLEIIEYYKSKDTKIIVWDLDHKLTKEDEILHGFDAIFETSVNPVFLSQKRVRVEPPVVINDLLQFPTVKSLPQRKLVYVGSRYERDDVIEEWIHPVSRKFPYEIEFWGNWLKKENLEECRNMWPNILYNDRITVSDFQRVYSTAVACPLLAKKSYFKSGFMTPRPWEALMFGTIPVGLSEHTGIEEYTDFIAQDSQDLCEIVDLLSKISVSEKDHIRKSNVEKIRFMDVKNFVNKIEEVA